MRLAKRGQYMIGAGRQSVKIDKVTAHLPIAATVGH